MKRIGWLLAGCVMCGWLAVGCGEQKTTLEPSSLQESFQGSEAQSQIQQAITSMEQGNYLNGVNTMTQVIEKTDLNKEQIDAIYEVITQVQKINSETPGNPDYTPINEAVEKLYSALRQQEEG
jgi:hypothetical protein